MQLSLFHDKPTSLSFLGKFENDNVLERLKLLDARARRKGLDSLDLSKNRLIGLGMESSPEGRVTKNSYGVFNLVWQSQENPDWAATIAGELSEIKAAIKTAHKTSLKFVIWAGMGGSAEDKSMYNAVGLLSKGMRLYVLDSTDPAKLKAILEDIAKRAKAPLAGALRSTLVVGMAMGMTSYEPVVNLGKLALLYEKNKVDSKANFIYLTLPGSLLDQFAGAKGYRKVELQPDNANGTAGRHSAPMTRGTLYPLGLAGNDLSAWMAGAVLTPDEINDAWRLASFLQAQSEVGRDKVTLLLPKHLEGVALWTKQNFEESLGKSESSGIKIVIGEKLKLANYRPPKDPLQDRAFLAIQEKGAANEDSQKARRAGYPTAALTLTKDAPLSRYLQFIHYAVFGLAYLRDMNFVTQPSVELYKAITNRLHAEATEAGGIEKTAEWQRLKNSPRQLKWRGGVTLYLDRVKDLAWDGITAPEAYALLLKSMAEAREIEYGELTFFGDMRYSATGRAVRKVLDHAAESVFRAPLKMPVDVYEGPAMNHSYHEMIIGHGRCFSTVLLAEKGEKLPAADYTPDYHRAQFLATQMALQERGRAVVAIVLKDLEAGTLVALDSFFREAAKVLKANRLVRSK
ncbi:MAG: hypothetical protein ABI693_03970 [Bryobacteraceae bacterium]